MATNTSFLAFYKKYYKEIRQIIAVVLLVGVVSMYFDQYLLSYFFLDTKYHISVLDWVVVSIGLLMITYWIINLKIGYRYSFHQFLVLLSLSIIYLVIFHTSNQTQFWTFKSPFFDCLSDVPYIRFLHQILLIFYFHLGVQIVSQFSKGKEEPSQNRYLQDIPIKTNDFKFKHITEEIRALIKETKFKSAFSIAVLGKWGQGKSTFIEQLKDEIKGEDYIIIDFLPFYSQKEDELVMDFFTSLKESLRFYSGNITRNIEDYAISLLKIYKRGELESLLKSNALSDKGVKSQFELIKNDIEQIDKKIIVFIDDVDRLNEKEIIQLLKLIRNSSNFPNVYFFLCFDKEYVLNEVIKEKEFITQSNYLDKFFQLEIVIPETRQYDLIQTLSIKLEELGLSNYYTYLHDEQLFLKYIQNYRDLTRFINQFQFVEKTILPMMNEISKEDFLLITLLQFKFPTVHKWLFNARETVLIKNKGYYIFLKRESEYKKLDSSSLFNSPMTFDDNSIDEQLNESYLQSNGATLDDLVDILSHYNVVSSEHNNENSILIASTLERLFPLTLQSISQLNYKQNFIKYYTLTYSSFILSKKDINTLLTTNDDQKVQNVLDSELNLQHFIEHAKQFVKGENVDFQYILKILGAIDQKNCTWKGQEELYKILFSLKDEYPELEEGVKFNLLNLINDKTYDLYSRLNFMFPQNVATVNVKEWLLVGDVEDLIAHLFEQEQKDKCFKFNDFISSLEFVSNRFYGDLISKISDNYLKNNLEYVLVNILESPNNFEYTVHLDYKHFFGNFKQMQEYLSRDLYSANKKVAEFLQFIELSRLTGENPIIFDFNELNLTLNQFLNNQETKNKINCQFLFKMLESAGIHQYDYPRITRPCARMHSYIIYESVTAVENISEVFKHKDAVVDLMIKIAKEKGFTKVENSIISKDNYKFKIVDDYGDVVAELIYFNYNEI